MSTHYKNTASQSQLSMVDLMVILDNKSDLTKLKKRRRAMSCYEPEVIENIANLSVSD